MNKIYACSDLHGEYALWGKIKNYCDATDKVYFLGDAADRGKDGIKIMQELIADPRVIYIKGNHEDIFCEQIYRWLTAGSLNNFSYWKRQGGYETMNGFYQLEKKEQQKLYNAIVDLPYMVTLANNNNQEIYLTHAGFTPSKFAEHNFTTDEEAEQYLIWNRLHFDEEWENFENSFVVHGHTPERIGEMRKYANGHKFNIDTAVFVTGVACLLDLDTFKPIYFRYEEEKQ